MNTSISPDKSADPFWLRLDNAAKIYPAIKDNELTSVFRIAVELKDRVKIKPFLEAIQTLEERFPYYKVKLKAGFFWYYLEHYPSPITVEVDRGTPCRAFGKKELMFRVLVIRNRISVEFSHILTDGTGGFEFLKTLLLTYFEKSGLPVPDHVSFFRPQQAPAQEEYEDAYSRYFKKLDTSAVKIPRAFHLPFGLKNKPRFEVLLATLPIEAVKQKAKEYGVSLTEYLSAVYLYALQQIYHQQSPLAKRLNSNILRIEVPVNLRKLYPTRSMRNFTLYVLPQIDLRLGPYSFDEIVKIVFHQMQLETDKKLINKMIFRNVSGERHPFLRRVPLFIKSLFLSQLYTIGTQQYSGVVTNLGKIDLGAELNNLISHFVFIPPPPNKVLKVNCGVAGFGDQVILSFGNITTSRELERHFFTYLAKQAIPVKILDTFRVEP